jgi:hypothetical protein
MSVELTAQQIGKKLTEIIANDKSASDLRTEIEAKDDAGVEGSRRSREGYQSICSNGSDGWDHLCNLLCVMLCTRRRCRRHVGRRWWWWKIQNENAEAINARLKIRSFS